MNTFERIFASRKVWVAIGGVVLAILAAHGVDEARVTPVVSSITALASAVILAIGYEDGAAANQKSNLEKKDE